MKKILIAITSCKKDAIEGLNQAQRDTFLKDVSKYPGLEYKFFIGDGTPTKENESIIRSTVKGCVDNNRGVNYEFKCRESERLANKYSYSLIKEDEVVLPVADDYFHLVYKVKEIHRWAMQNEFDFVYKCDTDTYVDIDRLMSSGFENYDFSGGPAGAGSVAGGGGYWISKKASQYLANGVINYWAEDVWVSGTLKRFGISLHIDTRYSDSVVRANNNLISTHLGFKSGYRVGMMYETHINKSKVTKILIAISSWVKGANNGDNQAMRDTCLKNVSRYPGLDYRFFIGDGTPTGVDDEELVKTLETRFSYPGHKTKALATRTQEPFNYTPKEDEIILHVPDGYLYMSYKTRESHRWAIENGYEYIFQCFPDTYIHLQRLMDSGFMQHDYVGHKIGDKAPHYASGGCGYWLSAKASRCLLGEPIKDWAEDRWVGDIMHKNRIPLHHDVRYIGLPDYPNSSNNVITCHLCDTPKVYDSKEMHDIHKMTLLPGKVPNIPIVQRPIKSTPIVSPVRPRILPKFQRRSIVDKSRFR